MKLDNLNLQELSKEEMRNITGGSFFGRIWRWLKSHFTAEIVDTPGGVGVVGGTRLIYKLKGLFVPFLYFTTLL